MAEFCRHIAAVANALGPAKTERLGNGDAFGTIVFSPAESGRGSQKDQRHVQHRGQREREATEEANHVG